MAAVVTSMTPGRGRPGALVLINGSGFDPDAGQNAVTFGGVPAGINTASPTQLQVVAPLGMAVDQHLAVVITNLTDATSATWYWWSKDTVANTDAMLLRNKVPGHDEKLRGLGRLIKNMAVAEGRFFERLATKIELVRDLLAAKGNFFSKAGGAIGVRQAPAGTSGQVFVSGVDDTGGQFQDRQCFTLQWGRLLDSTTLTDLMEQGSQDDFSGTLVNTVEIVPQAGQLALLSVRERTSATSRVNRVEILVDGVVEYDVQNGDPDFPGPGIRQESITFYPGIRVAQGALVEIRISRNNDSTDCSVLAYGLVA